MTVSPTRLVSISIIVPPWFSATWIGEP